MPSFSANSSALKVALYSFNTASKFSERACLSVLQAVAKAYALANVLLCTS